MQTSTASDDMAATEAQGKKRKPRGDWIPTNYDLRDTWFPEIGRAHV